VHRRNTAPLITRALGLDQLDQRADANFTESDHPILSQASGLDRAEECIERARVVEPGDDADNGGVALGIALCQRPRATTVLTSILTVKQPDERECDAVGLRGVLPEQFGRFA